MIQWEAELEINLSLYREDKYNLGKIIDVHLFRK
jgi:hypothetical protein